MSDTDDWPARLLVSDLCNLLARYLPAEQLQEVYQAYLFSAEAHQNQTRRSGEPYVYHPVAVAYILGQMHMDQQTLCAALLHDVIEDTKVSKETVEQLFDAEIAELVDGVSKLNAMHFESREHAKAESFRKMLLAMHRDIRVIIVKLADRLHNMRTLRAMKRSSQIRIAQETLDIYAPIANRLGMNDIRIELEDLSFQALHPLRYLVVKARMKKLYQKREDIIGNIQTTLEQNLAQYKIEAQVIKRHRHYYGIYRRMCELKQKDSANKQRTFTQATQLCSYRIISSDIDACYRALGIMHNTYKPRIERFRDYIAIPKVNGYQSLHTELFTSYGLVLEIQIRTAEMHQLAEQGITAQGIYQTEGNIQYHHDPKQRARDWLKNILEIQKKTGDSIEFLENVKTDLFSEEVYVFTPTGDILQLPQNATVIDFAYAVHSDVGNHAVSAQIDHRPVPLNAPLVSGQTVNIKTQQWARPNPAWLDFSVTAKARTHIHHFLKNQKKESAIIFGERLLNKELSSYQLSIEQLTTSQKKDLVEKFKVDDFDNLLADIGLGNHVALVIAQQFSPTFDHESSPLNDKPKPLVIKGTEGAMVTFMHCCYPIPGDSIVGFASAGRGIMIHSANCPHIINCRTPDKLLPVEWENEIEKEFLIDIHLHVRHERGVLATVAAALTDLGCNIEHVSSHSETNHDSMLKLTLWVKHRNHLAEIMRHLRQLKSVIRIQRTKND